METLLSPVITILCLIIVIILLSRWRKPGTPEIQLEKIAEAATRQAFTTMMGISPAETERIKPKEGADVPKSLQEALIIYFDQLHASRIILRILAKHFEGERVRFPQLAKAVRNEIELKGLDDIPETAMRATLRLLVGANLVNGSEGSFKLTGLGKQLQAELDSRLVAML